MNNFKIISSPQQVSMGDAWYELADPKHFWIKWRMNVLVSQIKQHLHTDSKILEIGCGNGLVMQQFKQNLNLHIDGCDLNEFALENAFQDLQTQLYLYDIFDEHVDFLGKYDIILLLDVVEHIEDPVSFLQQAMKHLKPGGLVYVSVPANQGLYSKFDKVVGHVKRYSKTDLQDLSKELGLVQSKSGYWGFSLLPLTILRKIWIRSMDEEKIIKTGFKPPSKIINSIFNGVRWIETSLFSSTFIGTSAFMLGWKKESQ